MPKSEIASGLDEIQKPIAVILKQKGFKKSGRTFNRLQDDGVVHVVSFQMGQFPIGDYVIPGIRESFYGKFAVNLGVMLPCVLEIEQDSKPKKIYQEYDCQIRERLGSLAMEGRSDIWWNIEPPFGSLISEITNLLENLGIPFLNQFLCYRNVLNYFDEHMKLPFQNEGRSALEIALIYWKLGDFEQSKVAFQKAKANAKERQHAGFFQHVEKIEKKCFG